MSYKINLAIAMRMATLLQLHREETYVLVNPTEDLIVSGESARRTFVGLYPLPSVQKSFADFSSALVDAAQPG